jgi:alkanesulfonate monooxygenase SsuD/methylene tetrahydromethanopterin reductase-like flavin-dependent oxidoreductase (luciferase family)
MEFGVFDHIDRSGQPLQAFYETRLRLAEAYDRGGFYAYHVAEHHGTPLGMAPSPGIFLAAVAQRTKRLRLGPLVYILPLYNPLRLIDEIAMLDQISGGRLELGVGRGTSPLEAAQFNSDHGISARVYAEALEVVVKGMTQPLLNHEGEFYRFKNVPIELAPLQKPHPPLWIGGHSVDGAARAASLGAHYVTQDSAEATRPYAESFRAAWRDAWGEKPFPKIGLLRFIVVAPTDDEAQRIARRAYPVWHAAYDHLHRKHGLVHERAEKTADFDVTFSGLRGVCGSPQTVTNMLRAQAEISSVNYLVGQFFFGDMTEAEVMNSVELFQRQVMPALKEMKS